MMLYVILSAVAVAIAAKLNFPKGKVAAIIYSLVSNFTLVGHR